MKWTPGGESQDVEDRRDEDSSGGGGGFQFGGMHIGIGGAVVLLVLSLVFKQNFFALLGGGGPASAPVATRPDPTRTAAEKPLVQFISFVLDDTQKNWEQILPDQAGKQYRHAKLVLFRNYTQSGCGAAESATGPFYCPEDEKVYIDLGFYDELQQRFGAPGQFAQAYVLAHEVGHHVQKLVGIEAKVRQLQEQNPKAAESSVGADGVASRLPCGGLGALDAAARAIGERRRGIGVGGRGGGGRRQTAENGLGACEA